MKKIFILLLLFFAEQVFAQNNGVLIRKGVTDVKALTTGTSGQVLTSNGSDEPSWQNGGGGGGSSSSPITAMPVTLNKAQNTTDSIIIFRVSIPANTWADGQTIAIKELYLQGHYDPLDTDNAGAMFMQYKIGDSLIDNLDTDPGYEYPDTGHSWVGFQVRRIGNDIYFANGGQGGTVMGTGASYPTEASSIYGKMNGTNNILPNAFPFGDGNEHKPYTGILRNVDFTQAQDITFSLNFVNAFPQNYYEATSATVYKYSDTGTVVNGGAGGDLTGAFPNPTVSKLKGNTVPSNSSGTLNNDGSGNLTWNAGSNLYDVSTGSHITHLFKEVLLDSAQIVNLIASPDTLIPAPGSGYMIVPTNVILICYTTGQTAYTVSSSGNLTLNYSTTSDGLNLDKLVLSQADNSIGEFKSINIQGSYDSYVNLSNQPLLLSQVGITEYSDGNAPVRLEIEYLIVPVH